MTAKRGRYGSVHATEGRWEVTLVREREWGLTDDRTLDRSRSQHPTTPPLKSSVHAILSDRHTGAEAVGVIQAPQGDPNNLLTGDRPVLGIVSSLSYGGLTGLPVRTGRRQPDLTRVCIPSFTAPQEEGWSVRGGFTARVVRRVRLHGYPAHAFRADWEKKVAKDPWPRIDNAHRLRTRWDAEGGVRWVIVRGDVHAPYTYDPFQVGVTLDVRTGNTCIRTVAGDEAQKVIASIGQATPDRSTRFVVSNFTTPHGTQIREVATPTGQLLGHLRRPISSPEERRTILPDQFRWTRQDCNLTDASELSC